MNGYLSYLSAAVVWDIPYIETIIGSKITEGYVVDITVSSYSVRFFADGKNVHASELALPDNAVIISNGSMVASPELLFMEFA